MSLFLILRQRRSRETLIASDKMSRLEGAGLLLKRLRALPVKVRARTGPAVQKNAEELAAMMRSIAPVDSGALKASIKAIKEDDLSVRVKAGGAPTMVEIREGSGVMWDYALGIEFGIAPHKAGGKFEGAAIPAIRRQPFFWPVYRLVKRRYRSRIAAAMRKGIKDALA